MRANVSNNNAFASEVASASQTHERGKRRAVKALREDGEFDESCFLENELDELNSVNMAAYKQRDEQLKAELATPTIDTLKMPKSPTAAKRGQARVIDEEEEVESREEADCCMPLLPNLSAVVAADDNQIAQEDSLDFGGMEEAAVFGVPQKAVCSASPDVNVKGLQTSLEHLRIKTIESSDEDSEEEDADGDVLIFKHDLGTFEFGSVAAMDMPRMVLDDEIKSGVPIFRRDSEELMLGAAIRESDLEFSKTLVE